MESNCRLRAAPGTACTLQYALQYQKFTVCSNGHTVTAICNMQYMHATKCTTWIANSAGSTEHSVDKQHTGAHVRPLHGGARRQGREDGQMKQATRQTSETSDPSKNSKDETSCQKLVDISQTSEPNEKAE